MLKTYSALFACLLLLGACNTHILGEDESVKHVSALEKRNFDPILDGQWIGNGISYSAYRDGESPGDLTSKDDIFEDLQILSARWNLIRLYGSDPQSQHILEVIEQHKLPIRVMLGIWLDAHKTAEENTRQVNLAITLANRFTDIVIAVNVGNEIFVDWSYHRIDDMDSVIAKIRRLRNRVSQPVTVSDDYNFWNKPQAKKIADEVDFICLHAYAFWNNQPLEASMEWTVSIYQDIQNRFPNHTIAYCETGWPTSRIYNDGSYEGGLIGVAGEAEQLVFFNQYDAWAKRNRIISFYFSSFDEQWKGGFDGDNPMAKAEKNWGLFHSDRQPKKALQ